MFNNQYCKTMKEDKDSSMYDSSDLFPNWKQFELSQQYLIGGLNIQPPSMEMPIQNLVAPPSTISNPSLNPKNITVKLMKDQSSIQQFTSDPRTHRIDNYIMKKANKVINKVAKRLGLKKIKNIYEQLKIHQTSYFLMLLCIIQKNTCLFRAFEIFEQQMHIEISNAKKSKKEVIEKYLKNAQKAFLAFINQDHQDSMNILFFKGKGLKNIKKLQQAKQKMEKFRQRLGL